MYSLYDISIIIALYITYIEYATFSFYKEGKMYMQFKYYKNIFKSYLIYFSNYIYTNVYYLFYKNINLIIFKYI